MGFDEWLLQFKGITWERYLGLSDEEQDRLLEEYESHMD